MAGLGVSMTPRGRTCGWMTQAPPAGWTHQKAARSNDDSVFATQTDDAEWTYIASRFLVRLKGLDCHLLTDHNVLRWGWVRAAVGRRGLGRGADKDAVERRPHTMSSASCCSDSCTALILHTNKRARARARANTRLAVWSSVREHPSITD